PARSSPRLYTPSLHDALPIYALHESLVILPVAIGRRDRHLQLVPSVLARQLALETRYEIAMAVQVRERLAPGRTVDDIARVILQDRKSTRLNSSHQIISYAVF